MKDDVSQFGHTRTRTDGTTVIRIISFFSDLQASKGLGVKRYGMEPSAPLTSTLAEVERLHIIKTLLLFHGNRTKAAKALNISLRGLRNKIREFKAQGYDMPAATVGPDHVAAEKRK